MKKVLCLASLVLLFIMGGCSSEKHTPIPSPAIIPPPSYVEPEEAHNNPGSIYMNSNSDGLFADTRARRVGDIVMIKIVENSTAKNKADTTADKENSSSYGIDAFLSRKALGQIPIGAPMVSTSTNSSTSATGEITREGKITGTIAARVLRVMPGGLLEIEGTRETRISDERQYIVVKGLIRPIDIGPDNTISSDRISDAKIEYYGEGALSEKQKSGWFIRIMDNLWPF